MCNPSRRITSDEIEVLDVIQQNACNVCYVIQQPTFGASHHVGHSRCQHVSDQTIDDDHTIDEI